MCWTSIFYVNNALTCLISRDSGDDERKNEVVQESEVKVGKQRGVRWFLERKEVIKQEE